MQWKICSHSECCFCHVAAPLPKKKHQKAGLFQFSKGVHTESRNRLKINVWTVHTGLRQRPQKSPVNIPGTFRGHSTGCAGWPMPKGGTTCSPPLLFPALCRVLKQQQLQETCGTKLVSCSMSLVLPRNRVGVVTCYGVVGYVQSGEMLLAGKLLTFACGVGFVWVKWWEWEKSILNSGF